MDHAITTPSPGFPPRFGNGAQPPQIPKNTNTRPSQDGTSLAESPYESDDSGKNGASDRAFRNHSMASHSPPDSNDNLQGASIVDHQGDDSIFEITTFISDRTMRTRSSDSTQNDMNPSTAKLVVDITSLSAAERAEFQDVYSEIVDHIMYCRDLTNKRAKYNVEFSDGRVEKVSLNQLLDFENGANALEQYMHSLFGDTKGRKRKIDETDGFDTETDAISDNMRIHNASDVDSEASSVISSDNMKHVQFNDTTGYNARPMRLRKLPQRDMNINNLSSSSLTRNGDQKDASDAFSDDDTFLPVVSDIASGRGRPSKRSRRTRSRFQSISHSNSNASTSDRLRRSTRSTQNRTAMNDGYGSDDEIIYAEERSAGTPKIAAIKETFPPTPSNSPFGLAHMTTCQTCSGSGRNGQLIFCQGCSLSYHKACLGVRSAREHLVTKVGNDKFVLQCKYCIGTYLKKDRLAPRHSRCQNCRADGRSCAPFSERKTARQEEKDRHENGGVDPVTDVNEVRLNNAETILSRCVTCRRAWHLYHTSQRDGNLVGTDLSEPVLNKNWECSACENIGSKIDRLVAWRIPPSRESLAKDMPLQYENYTDDEKEYLIKWEDTSYRHCSWMSGAWVFGLATGAMRTSFAKRDSEGRLYAQHKKDAIFEEFTMPDIILDAQPRGNSSGSLMPNDITQVESILVKFQGLGYDDVVWDSPPPKEEARAYKAYQEAYSEFVRGRNFKQHPPQQMKERIKTFKKSQFIPLTKQPDGLQRGKLMEYQIEGLNWLLENYHQSRSVVLADEMGLGKTVQVISLVLSLVEDKPQCSPFLIVVPNATCPNWRREFRQWTPNLRVVTYHGGKASQDLAYKYELFPVGSKHIMAHAVIMSYESAQDPRTASLFKSVQWAGLVVDEAQRLKNDQNLLYEALTAMKIPFRLLLTGTPLQNNKRELFNLLQFIDNSQDAAKLDEEYGVLDKETLPKLHEQIRPYFLRRTKLGVLKFLPPMAQIILPVTMTSIQEKLSKSIMSKNPQLIKAIFANSKMKSSDRGSLNNILMQLRKCLCHPFMYSQAIEEHHHDQAIVHQNLVEASAKLILLQIMLPKLKNRGHRVLIFSQFLQQLDIIEDFLGGMKYEYRRLDGQISSLEKQRRIDDFNAPGSSVFAFLLSTRAGGVGINLATADTVIIMDPDFNPHQDIQALSRAHRIGQKKKVLCFQLVTKSSVEERIMEIGRKKMALDHALIESMDDEELEGTDLESILKHGAQALFNDDYQKSAIQYDSASVDKLLDRSSAKDTESNVAGAAETQFFFARVWANDKDGFEDGFTLSDDDTLAQDTSSVWDRILQQREEDARLEAEANKEVLGRGGRKRQPINYRGGGFEAGFPSEDIGPESDKSGDEFQLHYSDESNEASDGEEQHEGIQPGTKPDINRAQHLAQYTKKTPAMSRKTPAFFDKATSHRKQTRKFKPAITGNSEDELSQDPSNGPQPSENHRAQQQVVLKSNGASNFRIKTEDNSNFSHPQLPLRRSRKYPVVHSSNDHGIFNAFVSRYPNMRRIAPITTAGTPQDFELYMPQLYTEAHVRVAIDIVQKSWLSVAVKNKRVDMLRHRLDEICLHRD